MIKANSVQSGIFEGFCVASGSTANVEQVRTSTDCALAKPLRMELHFIFTIETKSVVGRRGGPVI
jgi:hypothetical protein